MDSQQQERFERAVKIVTESRGTIPANILKKMEEEVESGVWYHVESDIAECDSYTLEEAECQVAYMSDLMVRGFKKKEKGILVRKFGQNPLRRLWRRMVVVNVR